MDTSSSSVRLPCLALEQHGDGSNKPALFSISEKKAIAGNIPGLTNTNAWPTPQGWILVRDTASATTFLQNPHDSDDKIQLPHLPQDLPSRCSCLLSGKPAALTGGCVVLLVHPFATAIWYCRIGDDEEWAKHDYDIGIQAQDKEKVPICPIAACDGRFYFNADALGNIGVLEFAPTPAFASVEVAVDGEFDYVDSAQVFLVESEGELYMVSMVYEYGGGGVTD
ncbi:hypothetical protein E2562_033066 [Oryza meyeriana var. granulata]|uniref:KIB1-4 beta-propeller domain-containing protein n=1 Tax=Oryza meyeriana var. granulata TaxID=110450 RepID=A0A6G1DRD5_9ORYZ|nr:hypothetical protein E2562_033066 [Oryza meyeriana var. granulata]